MAWRGARPPYTALAAQQAASGFGEEPMAPGPSPINAPSGYVVDVPNLYQTQALLLVNHPPSVPLRDFQLGRANVGGGQLHLAHDPRVGQFVRDAELVPGVLGQRPAYVPAWTGDRLGRPARGFGIGAGFSIGTGAAPGAGEVETPVVNAAVRVPTT